MKWFTATFNRSLMKWGLSNSKFWTVWYNAGLVTTIVLFPVAVIIVCKMTLDNWLSTSLTQEKKDQMIEVLVSIFFFFLGFLKQKFQEPYKLISY